MVYSEEWLCKSNAVQMRKIQLKLCPRPQLLGPSRTIPSWTHQSEKSSLMQVTLSKLHKKIKINDSSFILFLSQYFVKKRTGKTVEWQVKVVTSIKTANLIKNSKNTNLSKTRIAPLALCSFLQYPYKSNYIFPEIILSISKKKCIEFLDFLTRLINLNRII